jgi:hypothetical protein
MILDMGKKWGEQMCIGFVSLNMDWPRLSGCCQRCNEHLVYIRGFVDK